MLMLFWSAMLAPSLGVRVVLLKLLLPPETDCPAI
jgi:hypothetical protein